jgi:folate-dependent phosphoribosylglycinamide formyltransferase PurN
VLPKDSVEDIQKKVRKLEHNYYPEVIEDLLDDIRANEGDKKSRK